MAAKILMYCVEGHKACDLADQFLTSKGVKFEKVLVDTDMKLAIEMWARSECHTLPQIFIDNDHIGSLSELLDMEESGELDQILKN